MSISFPRSGPVSSCTRRGYADSVRRADATSVSPVAGHGAGQVGKARDVSE